MLPKRRDTARERLSQEVRVLHDIEELRVTIVFDGRGSQLSAELPFGAATFAHVFTPTGTTADDVIEQLVGRATNAAAVQVATDDRAERGTVEALGASAISAADLLSWIARTRERQSARMKHFNQRDEQAWKQRPEEQ